LKGEPKNNNPRGLREHRELEREIKKLVVVTGTLIE
jgi:hypothetical protein